MPYSGPWPNFHFPREATNSHLLLLIPSVVRAGSDLQAPGEIDAIKMCSGRGLDASTITDAPVFIEGTWRRVEMGGTECHRWSRCQHRCSVALCTSGRHARVLCICDNQSQCRFILPEHVHSAYTRGRYGIPSVVEKQEYIKSLHRLWLVMFFERENEKK